MDEKGKEGMVGRNHAYKPVVLKEDLSMGEVLSVQTVDATPTWILGHRVG